MQQQLADNVNQRLSSALDTLKERHATGRNEVDDADRAPTGEAYLALAQERRAFQQQEEERRLALKREHEAAQLRAKKEKAKGEDDSDDDSDFEDEFDPALDAIRQRRLEELRAAQIKNATDIARGHGQYRTIAQDDFLPECTGGSDWVAVHFFHREFQRCAILDHHLKLIAESHTECKFLRIDAEKAPFFVTKLQVRTLPTLIVFCKGKATDRLVGFEGLSKSANDPDQWETSRLQEWLGQTGAIDYKPPPTQLREQMERLGIRPSTVYRGGISTYDEEE